MKKAIKWGLLVTAAVSLNLAIDTTANAATYHKGTPTAVRGWWRTKMKKVHYGHGKYLWTYTTMHVTKNRISGAFGTQSDHYEIKKLYSYTASKKNNLFIVDGTYTLGNTDYFEAFHPLSKKKLETASINSKGIIDGTIYTWYKFSGKASSKTFYPYN
ncbi:hypothetical protein [Levilactobacillus acidifarinae]|uniref:Uncharacterized protein n=1 Tax=Levilactobacillus acidifarinae DSM 19394 = JCM 15949 TaxID=1423715 RepID=A0A0R1LJ81_9LACO|nr:hypothetical protein [Levilactobacillus acidifarinae]KRK95958.1 hypothetical protein FD25_GL002419 [Levilactobacillus acidifarinae DSM 19394]GEO69263.1 hypothetical protein LAC03_11730 [Levilactobacillus acidifarinae]